MSAAESHVGYCLLDVRGRVIAQQTQDRPFYAASTMKLAVMVAVAQAVDAGHASWSDGIEVRRSFESAAPGAGSFSMSADDTDEALPADGTTATVRELVEAMIARSSNEATNLLLGMVGIPAAAAVWPAIDPSCRLERLIGDAAAQARGATNEVTPSGLARLLHLIVTGRLASQAATEIMIDALQRQEFPRIAEVLPARAVWGSKSGWVPGIEHDAAFVGDPAGDDLVVLAVCTQGLSEQQGRATIRQVAEGLLDRM